MRCPLAAPVGTTGSSAFVVPLLNPLSGGGPFTLAYDTRSSYGRVVPVSPKGYGPFKYGTLYPLRYGIQVSGVPSPYTSVMSNIVVTAWTVTGGTSTPPAGTGTWGLSGAGWSWTSPVFAATSGGVSYTTLSLFLTVNVMARYPNLEQSYVWANLWLYVGGSYSGPLAQWQTTLGERCPDQQSLNSLALSCVNTDAWSGAGLTILSDL